MVLQAVVLGAFMVVYCVHWGAWRAVLRGRGAERPSKATYASAVVRFVTIAYTTLALVPLQMIQCVSVAGRCV